MPTPINETEPFPSIEVASSRRPDNSESPPSPVANRPAASSSLSGRIRRASQSFGQSEIPEGFSAATGSFAATVFSRPSATRSRTGSTDLTATGASIATDGQTRRNTVPEAIEEAPPPPPPPGMNKHLTGEPTAAVPFPNGYHFPPNHSFAQSTAMGLRAFWSYFLTPLGFVVTIYGLNIVAWGGMLFLLLCNASPAMCHPSCNDINSPRRKWIEWDSQILNALFCVTGFGLAPWRFRDLYFLLQYRLQGKELSLRKLAAIHRGWFRLEGSAELPANLGPQNIADSAPGAVPPNAIPFPEAKIPDPPLTGQRAPATTLWRMDLVIWLMVSNTFLQCVLSGFMWGMTRYTRPSWATGLFVALGCLVAAFGGYIMFLEGKRVKSIEGVPVSAEDLQQLQADREKGVWHFNNIKDKDPSEEKNKTQRIEV
ncbi:hypothetical protein BGZ63DRAFT_389444 [Mariannaea sp. PMI_226]|nr:hypothetical protein BGZ63DRAFT_389444 [Mariannaea sp. PMI_226]